MITADGARWLLALVAAAVTNASIVVRDGSGASASANATARVDGGELVLTAVFGEDEANFSWRERALLVGGVEVDVERRDEGRKAPGQVWTVETVLLMPKA